MADREDFATEVGQLIKGRSPVGHTHPVADVAGLAARLAELEYDTGWRNLTGALINGWTATDVRVRRAGDWGHLRFRGLSGAQATSTYFAGSLTGFFAGDQNIAVKIGTTHANVWVMGNGSAISLPTDTAVSGTVVQASQYLGDLAKPTTLPGTPA